ncbi:hypothetical protein PTKIN_Ptkin04bG0225600 [Pterospermum kingtungense]
MADYDPTITLGPASFWTQADALLRKNLAFQKRNMGANIRLICFPLFFCILFVLVDNLTNVADNGKAKRCGSENATMGQASSCPIPNPPEWPALLQIPAPNYRAVRTDSLTSSDLPNESCRRTGDCPAITLFTGNNQSLAEILTRTMFSTSSDIDSSNDLGSLATNVLGTETNPEGNNYIEPAFASDLPIYNVQRQCTPNSTVYIAINQSSMVMGKEVTCVQGLYLWRKSSSEVNDELYKGYQKGNSQEKINEFVSAYDFLNSDGNNFNVSIWYNSTYRKPLADDGSMSLLRIPRAVNLASNAYLQFLLGAGTKMLLEFVKEMPMPETKPVNTSISSLAGPLFFTWVILHLFPVVLNLLVYEKQQTLRIMMKMHGLGDGPYWMISYAYFLIISLIYMLCFVIFGSVIGLKFFTLNDYSIQFVFYFLYLNLQISLAFLVAGMFSDVKTATVTGYVLLFASGLLGAFLFQSFLENDSFPSKFKKP